MLFSAMSKTQRRGYMLLLNTWHLEVSVKAIHLMRFTFKVFDSYQLREKLSLTCYFGFLGD